jgi:hypothetical protein
MKCVCLKKVTVFEDRNICLAGFTLEAFLKIEPCLRNYLSIDSFPVR